jgi:hypothetical protein
VCACNCCVLACRDPFILEQPSRTNGNTWRVMIGAGIREPGTNFPCAGGTAAATAAAAATASTACIDGKHCTAAVGAANSTAAGEAQGFAGAAAARHADPRRAARGTALVYRSKQLLSGEATSLLSRLPQLDCTCIGLYNRLLDAASLAASHGR